MKTLTEQYRLIKEDKGHKGVFLKEAKAKYPNLLTNSSTFKEATTILKQKNIISENYVDLKPINNMVERKKEGYETAFAKFLAEAEAKAEEKKVTKEVEDIDENNYDYDDKKDPNNMIFGQIQMGYYFEMKQEKNADKTIDEIKDIVFKNLAKDPLHYVKEGQFGVQGLGYKEAKQQQSDGESYGGSGFSTKLKDGGDSMELVKESKELVLEAFGQVVTSGNPNSLAAQSGNIIRQMMAEKEEEKKLPMDEMEDEGTAVSYSDTTSEAAKPDFADIDGDGDKKEPMKQAAKDKKKKVKKESIDSKLAEIGKEAEKVKMEAQLDFLHDHINEKVNRVNSIQEDENLSELIDKSKMKLMQREIKDLERKKAKMERIYEKSCGSKYAKKGVVDEVETTEEV